MVRAVSIPPYNRENSRYIEKYQSILSLLVVPALASASELTPKPANCDTWTGYRNPHCTAHNDLRFSAIRVSELRATSQKKCEALHRSLTKIRAAATGREPLLC